MKYLLISTICLLLITSCHKNKGQLSGKWNIDSFEPIAKNISESDKIGLLLLQLAQAQMPSKVAFQDKNKLLFYDKDDNVVSTGSYEFDGKKGIFMTENDTTEFSMETITESKVMLITLDSIRIHLSR